MRNKYDDQVRDISTKLLMAYADQGRRNEFWRVAVAEIPRRDREYFACQVIGTLTRGFDQLVESHPHTAQVIRNLAALSDRIDFAKITEGLGEPHDRY